MFVLTSTPRFLKKMQLISLLAYGEPIPRIFVAKKLFSRWMVVLFGLPES